MNLPIYTARLKPFASALGDRMINQTIFTGGRFEKIGCYSRVRRVGSMVWVAGTTATEPTGRLHAPGDTYAQCIYIFGRIKEALQAVDADMIHVVRTTAFLTDMSQAGQFVRAHGEVFDGIFPVATAVQAGLTTPGMMVEIQVDAVLP